MEEKTLCKLDICYNRTKTFWAVSIILLVITIFFACNCTEVLSIEDNWDWGYEHTWVCGDIVFCFEGSSLYVALGMILFGIGFPIVSVIVHKFLSQRCSLVLTETQILGTKRAIFYSQKILIPIANFDHACVKATLSDAIRNGKTVVIKTASGALKFHYAHNAEEFVTAVMKQFQAAK